MFHDIPNSPCSNCESTVTENVVRGQGSHTRSVTRCRTCGHEGNVHWWHGHPTSNFRQASNHSESQYAKHLGESLKKTREHGKTLKSVKTRLRSLVAKSGEDQELSDKSIDVILLAVASSTHLSIESLTIALDEHLKNEE